MGTTFRIVVRTFRHYIWVSTRGEGCEQLYDQQNFEKDNLLGVKTPFVSMTKTHSCKVNRNIDGRLNILTTCVIV